MSPSLSFRSSDLYLEGSIRTYAVHEQGFEEFATNLASSDALPSPGSLQPQVFNFRRMEPSVLTWNGGAAHVSLQKRLGLMTPERQVLNLEGIPLACVACACAALHAALNP